MSKYEKKFIPQNFYLLSPVSLSPTKNIHMRIFSRIFELIWNGPSRILRGKLIQRSRTELILGACATVYPKWRSETTDRVQTCSKNYFERNTPFQSHGLILHARPEGAELRVHSEWQWPLSGVHPKMMEKLAQSGEGGGVHDHPLSLYHHVHSCAVRSSWDGRYTPIISTLLLCMYAVKQNRISEVCVPGSGGQCQPTFVQPQSFWRSYQIQNYSTLVLFSLVEFFPLPKFIFSSYIKSLNACWSVTNKGWLE